MKNFRFLLVPAFILATTACSYTGAKYLAQSSAQFTFKVRTTACFGTCPVYELEINNSGRAIYQGKKFTSVEGELVKTLPEAEIDSLRQLLVENRFMELDSVYNDKYVADKASMHLTLTSGEGQISKKVWSRHNQPERLLEIEAYIERLRRRYFSTRD